MKIPRALQYKIGKLIEEHCHPIEGREGFCQYDEGWSDERVRAAMDDPAVQNSHVRGMRMDLFGKLRDPRAPLPVKANGDLLDVDPRLDALEHNFNVLIERLAAHGVIIDDLLDLRIE